MHYFIDGYNLLFRVVRGGDNVTKRRQELIADLHNKISVVGLNVTLVFDSKYFPGGSEKSNFNSLEIIFSSVGETADELILDALHSSENPRNETVVTSDKKLAWYARLKSAKTIPVEDFIDLLNRRYRNKKAEKQEKKAEKKKIELKPLRPQTVKIEDGTMEYYLESFEKEFQRLETETPVKKKAVEAKPVKQKKGSKIPKKPEDDSITDMDRWLKAFERKIDREVFEENGV